MFLFRLRDCESQSDTRAAMASYSEGGWKMARRRGQLCARTHQEALYVEDGLGVGDLLPQLAVAFLHLGRSRGSEGRQRMSRRSPEGLWRVRQTRRRTTQANDLNAETPGGLLLASGSKEFTFLTYADCIRVT